MALAPNKAQAILKVGNDFRVTSGRCGLNLDDGTHVMTLVGYNETVATFVANLQKKRVTLSELLESGLVCIKMDNAQSGVFSDFAKNLRYEEITPDIGQVLLAKQHLSIDNMRVTADDMARFSQSNLSYRVTGANGENADVVQNLQALAERAELFIDANALRDIAQAQGRADIPKT